MSNLCKSLVLFFCSLSTISMSYAVTLEKDSSHKLMLKKTPIVKQLKVNLNLANAHDISKSFKGFGPKRAAAIVAYREAHGVFKAFKDLSLVKGISKRFIEKNGERLSKTFLL